MPRREFIQPEVTSRPPGKGPLPRIDVDTGAPFMARAGASIKMTPEGKLSFLQSAFGAGNVFTLENGEIVIRSKAIPGNENAKDDDFTLFDERGLTVRDVTADVAGEAIETAPMLATRSVPGTGAGGGLGNAARQVISALLPGSDEMSATERMLSVGGAAGIAAVSQVGMNMLFGKVMDPLRPKNLATGPARKAAETPFAVKGARLEDETGIPFTLGEWTGSRAQLMIEAIARRTPAAADDFFAFSQTQIQTAADKLRQAMEGIDPRTMGRFETGQTVIKAYDNALATARTNRRAQAKMDFGVVHDIAKGQRIIGPSNLKSEIESVIKEMDVPGAGDATQGVVNSAKHQLDTLIDPTGKAVRNLTAEQTERLLQVYTARQGGTGLLFKDMDKAQSKMIAGRLKDALVRDLDDAVESGGQPAQVAQALDVARGRYKANSQIVNGLTDSAVARLTGSKALTPEQIADRLAQMEPSAIRTTVELLERGDASVVPAIKQNLIADAYRAAEEAGRTQASKRTGQGIKWSATDFLKHLPDDDTLRAAKFTREELVEVKRVAKALERISDKEFQGSPTAPFHLTWDIARGLFTLNPATLGRAGGAIITPKIIAKASLDPAGRQQLLTLATTGAPTKKALAAALAFSAQVASEEDVTNIRPMEQ